MNEGNNGSKSGGRGSYLRLGLHLYTCHPCLLQTLACLPCHHSPLLPTPSLSPLSLSSPLLSLLPPQPSLNTATPSVFHCHPPCLMPPPPCLLQQVRDSCILSHHHRPHSRPLSSPHSPLPPCYCHCPFAPLCNKWEGTTVCCHHQHACCHGHARLRPRSVAIGLVWFGSGTKPDSTVIWFVVWFQCRFGSRTGFLWFPHTCIKTGFSQFGPGFNWSLRQSYIGILNVEY